MDTLQQTPEIESLALATREAKTRLEQTKFRHARHEATYDELAQAGKDFSSAFYNYQKAKFPGIKPRRVHYMSVIR